ncbi:unnamed protein product [Rhizopus microsporus]
MSIANDNQPTYRPVAAIAVIRKPISETDSKQPNIHDISRKPHDTLYLLVKKPRTENAWQFPQGGIKYKKRETLTKAALRELAEECGSDLQVNMLDYNEPFCIYQYDFPQDFVQKKNRHFKGARVQFVRAEWLSGQCLPDGEEIVDFAWLTREEVPSFVSADYLKGVMQILEPL